MAVKLVFTTKLQETPAEQLQTIEQESKSLICILFIKTEYPSSSRTFLLEISWIFIDYHSNFRRFRNKSHFPRDAKRSYEETYYSHTLSVVSTVNVILFTIQCTTSQHFLFK
ncbi:hypothetical protein CSKR_101209 [Clonorchis sinensis]|uniref:Uncharacterized protein n=1 Tax=Clonorchis sinensis TaxID=79923 RepID=A0A419Q8S7_CLOSI|nr:hypothetical protein CSKR_101209 [Clonorchis sinensis]